MIAIGSKVKDHHGNIITVVGHTTDRNGVLMVIGEVHVPPGLFERWGKNKPQKIIKNFYLDELA
jgi:hypothetical protein